MQLNIGHLSTMYHTSFVLMGTDCLEKTLKIPVHWKLFGGGPAIVQALAKGEVDLGYIGLPPVIIGIDKGVPIKCVGGGHVEGTVLMAKDDFKSLEDLKGNIDATLHQFKGKLIGSPPKGSIHDVIIRNLIKEKELEKEIIVKNFEWADFIPEAMIDDEIDAAVGTPLLAVATHRACNAKIIIPPNKLWQNNPSYGIIVKQDLIEHYPDLIVEFLKLHEKTSNFIRRKPNKAAKITSNVVKVVDEDFITQAYNISFKYCASLSKEFINSTLKFLQVLYELKYISKILTEKDIFDTRFIKKIHPEPPHY
ncbi:MAG: ABC transporter substrate-binding protein [Methanosarcinales archaeon]